MRRKKTPRKSISTDRASAYARVVVAGRSVAGPLVRAACARHLRDLEHGPKRGLHWDREAARRAIQFFPDVLRLPDGERAGEPFTLEPWQAFVVGSIFGWRRGKGGPRRFRTAYVETGKGSGKSPMGGGVGLYMLTADGEQAAECYAAAVTRDQAKIPFRDAVRMVDASPALSERLQKSGDREVHNLAHLKSGSFFRPISSEGRGLDGKRVHFALIDEVHEHPTDVVVEKITAGVKGRRQPLVLEITNSGVDRTTICYQHHEYSERVVQGQVQDDEWFAYVCALDEGEDPLESEACWPKANPSLGVTIKLEYLRKQVREAKGMPAKQSIVRRLNFCQWVDAANPAIDGELWRACEADFDEADLAGLEVVGALDLSGTRDLTALARVYEPDAEGIVHAVVEFWTPKDTLLERSRRDRVPYDEWVRIGDVTATPGRAIDYAFVAQRLAELQTETGLRRVAFDQYRIKYLEADLADASVELELVPHGQGFYKAAESNLWMPRSVELLEDLIGKGKLRVKKNAALTYAAASAVHRTDEKANRIYDKRRATGRIDGMVALAMAIGASGPKAAPDEPMVTVLTA
ncbi:MAG: terminase [Betaproteobacteria bacterium RIFCSPLOWO2_12_FULL_65_14]|nr:MAG: terminase [Betaproteobacteria bacterium RIFCSPLOWO2_12_FULL_65_14]